MTKNTPWRYTIFHNGKSPYDIVKDIQKSLKLSEGDIQHILTRTGNLIEKTSMKGRSYLRLILSCIYLYVNWKGSNKSPISVSKYISICRKKNYRLSKTALMDNVKFFKKNKIFPVYTNIIDTFNGYWPTIKEYFSLNNTLKQDIINIIINKKIVSGRSRNVILAGSIYYITKKNNMDITQKQLANFFGVTTVSIRNFTKKINEII